MGSTKLSADTETATSTTMAASVAYATDDSASDAKIGSASVFEISVSCNSPEARGRPTSARFATSRPSGRFVAGLGCSRVSVVVLSGRVLRYEGTRADSRRVGESRNLEGFLGPPRILRR